MPLAESSSPELEGQSAYVNTETTDCKVCGERAATCAELRSGMEFPIGSCCEGCAHGGGAEEDNDEPADIPDWWENNGN